MSAWQLATVANLVTAVAYLGISGLIVRGLLQTRQVHRNPLALATAAIFLTCAGHHGAHGLMLAGVTGHGMGHDGMSATMAMRGHLGWGLSLWDAAGGVIAVTYLSLRQGFGVLLQGPAMFSDRVAEEAHRRALDAIDRIAEAVATFDPDGRLEHTNAAADACFATLAAPDDGDRDAVWGRNVVDARGVVVPAEEMPVRRTRRMGLPVDAVELGVLGTDGRRRWLRCSTRPADDRATGPWPVIASFADVTDRVVAEQALRTSEELHRGVLEQLPDTMVTVYEGEDLRIRLMQGGTMRRGAVDYAEMGGRTIEEAVPAPVARIVEPLILEAYEGGRSTTEFHSDSSGSDWEVSVVPWSAPDGAPGALVVSSDVSARKRSDHERQLAQRRFADAFEHAPSGMALADARGRVLQCNAAFAALAGREDVGMDDALLLSLVHPDDEPRLARAIEDAEHGATTVEARVLHADGRPRWSSLTVCALDEDDAADLLVQAQDVTERRDYERRLEHLADHDPLTGLANRRSFERRLSEHLDRCSRYGWTGAVIMLDLDHFKTVNDTLGHAAGDRLIVAAAGALRSRLRESDVLARLGGDEFAVILPQGGRPEADAVCQALCDAVRAGARVSMDGTTASVTASVGVCVISGQRTAEELLIDADLAMYDAKDAGRDGWAASDGDGFDEPKLKARMAWVDRIRGALEHDRFELWAQPIVDLSDERTVGHELLLRMQAEGGELVPPGTFLYIAERFGLAPSIDRWVLRRGIDLLAREPGIAEQLSINISGHSVGDHGLLDLLEQHLARTGVDPARLMLEITETAAVADIPRARDFAERLRGIGCKLALDDFGAGFGGFYYLKHLPFDVLKLDGEFVRGCVHSQTDRLVIDAVVALTHGMGRRTVAECVEDEATVHELRRRGVDLGQGYHFARPMPLHEIVGSTAGPPALRPAAAGTVRVEDGRP